MAELMWVRANDKPAVKLPTAEGTPDVYVSVDKHVLWEVDGRHPGDHEVYVGPGTPPVQVFRTDRVNQALSKRIIVPSSEEEYQEYFHEHARRQVDALEREVGESGDDLRKCAMDRVLAERGYVRAPEKSAAQPPVEAVSAESDDDKRRGPGRPPKAE